VKGKMQNRADRAEQALRSMCQGCLGRRCGDGRVCDSRAKALARLKNARRQLQARQLHTEYARITWQRNACRDSRDQHPRRCVVAGCEQPYRARGYCKKHYMRVWRHGSPLEVKPGGCPWDRNIKQG
jgi:hypothetical protein